MASEGYKHCGRCNETKPLGEFYRCSRTKSGYGAPCKACKRRWSRENHSWRYPQHREKKRARQILNDAVNGGRLAKPKNCEKCGCCAEGRGLHGHHEDYGKPLEVEWLCESCHRERHAS